MSAGRPPLTTDRRLAPGTVLRRGASWQYRAAPFGGTHPGRTGAATDRNVELLISPPFPLARLTGR